MRLGAGLVGDAGEIEGFRSSASGTSPAFLCPDNDVRCHEPARIEYPCLGTTAFGHNVTTTNDQQPADGSLDDVADAHPADILGGLETGTGSALYTHNTADSSWTSDDAPGADPALGPANAADTDDGSDVPPSTPTPAGRSWRKPVLIGAAALVCVLAVAGGSYAAMNKTVTISVDGVSQEVSTLSGSVDGALDAAGLTVAEHDTLAPSAESEITDGSQIVLERGRLLTLTIDGQTRQVWTTATTVEEALAELGQDPSAFKLSANRTREIPLDGFTVTADTLHAVTVTVDGATQQLSSAAKTVGDLLTEAGIAVGADQRVSPALTTALADGIPVSIVTLPTISLTDGANPATSSVTEAATVGDVLAAAGITLGADDTVSPPVETAVTGGLQIAVTRIAYVSSTENQPIDQPADQTQNDSSMAAGTTSEVQQGQPGVVEVTYRTTVTNGQNGAREEVSRKTITEATPTITKVGTKKAAPAPQPAPAAAAAAPAPRQAAAPDPAPEPEPAPAPPAPSNSGGWSVNWDAIAKCESGNNWSINTGNGYYGGLQFDIRTWLGSGGGAYAPRADLASKDQQIEIAERVYAARGLSPWACGYAAG
jgi:uncharacterized protein YabE (DUF348 family)